MEPGKGLSARVRTICALTCSAYSPNRRSGTCLDGPRAAGHPGDSSYQADRTAFTRFIPAVNPEAEAGQWQDYYRRWQTMTLERIAPALLGRWPSSLPSAEAASRYPHHHGGETDVCVIATVLGAGDLGYRVLVVRGALCSVSDVTHDAALRIYDERFNQQVETHALRRTFYWSGQKPELFRTRRNDADFSAAFKVSQTNAC
jgi:hypothetical protein